MNDNQKIFMSTTITTIDVLYIKLISPISINKYLIVVGNENVDQVKNKQFIKWQTTLVASFFFYLIQKSVNM